MVKMHPLEPGRWQWHVLDVEVLLKMVSETTDSWWQGHGKDPTKKEKVAKGWLSDSLQRHFIVGSGSKNLELHRHLLGILRVFFVRYDRLMYLGQWWEPVERKRTRIWSLLYPNCSDVSWRWHIVAFEFPSWSPLFWVDQSVFQLQKQTAQRATSSISIYFGYLKSNFQRARNSSFESWNWSWNCSLTNPKPASGNMKMAADTIDSKAHHIKPQQTQSIHMWHIYLPFCEYWILMVRMLVYIPFLPRDLRQNFPQKNRKNIHQTTIHHHPFEFARRVYSFIPWRRHTPKDLPLCWWILASLGSTQIGCREVVKEKW